MLTTTIRRSLAVVATALALTSGVTAGMSPEASAAPYTTPQKVTGQLFFETAIEKAVFDKVNSLRINNGRSPLQWNSQAAQDAAIWAEHMAATGDFEHSEDPRYGENIYRSSSYANPDRIVANWITSNEHFENMLDGDYTEGGVAVAMLPNGRTYVVQNFLF